MSRLRDLDESGNRVQTCPNLSKRVQTCPKLSNRVQTCPKLSKRVQTCPKLSNRVQTCPIHPTHRQVGAAPLKAKARGEAKRVRGLNLADGMLRQMVDEASDAQAKGALAAVANFLPPPGLKLAKTSDSSDVEGKPLRRRQRTDPGVFLLFRHDWTRLDRFGHDWTRLDTIGHDWTGLDRIGPDSTPSPFFRALEGACQRGRRRSSRGGAGRTTPPRTSWGRGPRRQTPPETRQTPPRPVPP